MNFTFSQVSINAQNIEHNDHLIYSAKDSIIYDIENNQVFLYKDARLIYKNIELESGFMLIDFDKNMILAKGTYDSINNYK